MRTISIDDDLMSRLLSIPGFNTEEEVIQAAIEDFVVKHESKEPMNIFDLAGLNLLAEDYDYKALRRDKTFDTD